jgi:hypothetical protein
LINILNSYIYNDIVNDVVIVDFNSKINLRNFLIQHIDKKYFYKINIIEVTNTVPYIASYANNIGFYFCKNETILKLDADNIIVNSTLFFENYSKYIFSDDNFIHFSWENAKTENEIKLNDVFFTTKSQLINNGYYNNNMLFYGWEDCDIKNRHNNNNKEIFLDSKFFINQQQNEVIILENDVSVINIDFFGFNLQNIVSVNTLILYNMFLSKMENKITRDNDVLKIFSVKENYFKYCKVLINFENIQLFNTNLNYLSESEKSICNTEIFEEMCICTNNMFGTNNCIYNTFVTKYNICDIKQKIRLFYILFFNKKTQNINNLCNNLVITLYNEKSIDRCLELLFCLKTNTENEYISKIHILYENPDSNSFLFDIITNICSENLYDFNNKIIIHKITKRPTYNDIFNYCNKNIIGNTIIANSDIVYDETIENTQFLQEDYFISLTRYQKYDGLFKPMCLKDFNNKTNIFSQDSWIFISPLKHKLECSLLIGTFFCDSFLNFKLLNTNYRCFNLFECIKSYHVQNDNSTTTKYENNKELMDSRWNYICYELNNGDPNFLYGLKKNNLNDFINKKNYNNFIIWDDYIKNDEDITI